MAHTTVTKTYSQNNGTANTFSYSGSFDVFKATEVEVDLDNVKLTYTASTINDSANPREYSVDVTAKTIHIGGADLSSGTVVIRPVTDMGAPTPRATYTPGASITAEDLNNNQKQLMRKAMEYGEQVLFNTGGTMTGDITMGKDQTIIFEGATDNAHETTLTVADPTADRTITLPNVSGNVVTTGDTGTVATGMIADDAVTRAKIVNDAVDSNKIADDSIQSEHIADANVTKAHLADDSVGTGEIENSAVTTAKIANDAVTNAKIADTSVNTENLYNNAVTTDKIADNAVTGSKINNGSIDANEIASSAVTTAKIAADAVTNAKIADSAVTTAKIANDAINSNKIADDSIQSEHIADANVTKAHLADNSVGSGEIESGAVTTAKIAADAVTGTEIADDAVGADALASNAVVTASIVDSNVTTAKIADANVTTAKITDANVTTAKIANDAITIGKIGCEQTTISDSDSHVPTSGAVVDYVAAQLAPVGGLEVIATDAAFPNTQPVAGVVISIADAGGLVVNGSGVSTTGRTVGGSTVTINNINSQFNSTTIAAGVGMQVSSTGSSQTYNYHKALLKEADLKNLSNDIDDFGNRYRVHAGEPSSNNDDGDLVWDTNANKMKVYDATASAWTEVTSTGDFKFLVPVDAGTTTAATWDGSDTSFDLKETTNSGSAASVSNINQLIVSLNGVIQKPNTGSYSASEEGFYLTDTDTIRFCTAPPSGSSAFIIQCGSAVSIPTPGDGTVTEAKIASAAVTQTKIAKPIDLDDNEKIRFGTGDDLEIYHSGSHSFIHEGGTGGLSIRSGDLYLRNPSDADMIHCQSGGYVKLYYDGSEQIKTTSTGVSLGDSKRIDFGDGADLEIQHDGTNNYIDSKGTQLRIETDALRLRSDGGETYAEADANGAFKIYYDNSKKFETTSAGVTITGSQNKIVGDLRFDNSTDADKDIYWDESEDRLNWFDSVKATFGNSNDLEIYHDATNSFIKNATGDFNILGNAIYIKNADNDETYVKCIDNGAVEIYHDNVKKFESHADGLHIGDGGNLDMPSDSSKIVMGASDDLEIYHDGSNSRIKNSTGALILNADHFNVKRTDNSENILITAVNGACELYYDNSKKFETKSDGVTITGNTYAWEIYNNTTSGGANVRVQSSGLLQRDTSSRRYKNTIKDATHGLADLNKLRPVTYKGNKDGDTIFGGLIAEEVHDAGLTEFVDYDSDNRPDALQYGNMVSLCIKAIQELSAKVAALEAG